MTRRSLILASISPRRRRLLAVFGVPFRVREPRGVVERHDPRVSPRRIVAHNARLKADVVARRLSRGVVIAADTLVVLGREHFGKPSDAAHAARMLRRLSGRTHRVYTGVCVRDVDRGRVVVDVAVSRVTLRRLRAPEIARYVRSRQAHDKAGSYAIQDLRSLIVDRISGSLSNVIGLPLDVVERRLRQCGVLP